MCYVLYLDLLKLILENLMPFFKSVVFLQDRAFLQSIRVTSFGLRLMHKPAYEKRWVETVMRRSSQNCCSYSFGLVTF
jgi:hypothetical protein